MHNNDKKISLGDSLKLIMRGFGIIHKLIPAYMPLSFVNAVINAVLPLINLYLSARILNELAGGRDVRMIIIYVIITVALAFLLSATRSVISRKLTIINGSFYLKQYLLNGERYMSLDFEHVEKSETNDLLADIEAKTNGNGLGLLRLYWIFPDFIQHLFSIIISCGLLTGLFIISGNHAASFITSPFATILLCALVVLNMIFVFQLRQSEQVMLKRIFEGNAKANSLFHYYMNYFKVGVAGKDIRIYNQKAAIMKVFQQRANLTEWHKYFSFNGKMGGFMAAANAFVGGCIYLFIGLRALAGMYGIGNVVQYIGAITSIVDNLTAFISDCANLKVNSQYLALLYEFLDLPDVKYKGSLTTEKRSDNEYEIEFCNVSFKYPGSESYALRNLSIKFHVGQRLAVVGMNGSGKTTMIKLLCRLYDPTEGEITLNGIDIKKYGYNEYMNIFSVVFQDFKLFSFPLGQNVAANVNVDSQKVNDTLKKAGFSMRVDNMPKGLDTSLYKDFEEDGVEISGGEAQKIALARALYKDAPFIVLDEPTAALDPIAESEIYSKFNEIVGNKTVIYISHRLSSCRFCDDIAVFHEGQIIQRGSHEKLVAEKEGKYYELWSAQAQYYDEKTA